MKTITIHIDEADMIRFNRMKKVTGMTWANIVFAQLEQWEKETN
jgi:hypothetical protein